jgi:O-antigen/teichoic acid export membrane protein
MFKVWFAIVISILLAFTVFVNIHTNTVYWATYANIAGIFVWLGLAIYWYRKERKC